MSQYQLQDRLAALRTQLQKAVTLEFATLPPYLTALWSLHPGSNREAAAVIRGVMMEEMLHMTLAGNVLSALGGHVRLCGRAIPVYPLQLAFDGRQHRDRLVDIHLERFSAHAVQTFMGIELPARMHAAHADAATPELAIPDFTIGAFYDEIIGELRALCDEFDAAVVFTGNPAHQIAAEFFWKGGGQPMVVSNLTEAVQALRVVTAQGEGARGSMSDGDQQFFGQPDEVAHYFRFKQIACGRYYTATDSIHQPPSGALLNVDYAAVFPIRTDSRQADLAAHPPLAALSARFNAAYSMMLWQLTEGFAGNPPVFYTAIMNGMSSLSEVARALVGTPIPDDPQGLHAAPSFEWDTSLMATAAVAAG